MACERGTRWDPPDALRPAALPAQAVPFALGCPLSTPISLVGETYARDHRARPTEALKPELAPHAGLHLRHGV